MTETVERVTVREGYTVLLIAQQLRRLPGVSPRIRDFSVRMGNHLFRRALEAEGERVRADYRALEDHIARARFRVRRLNVTVGSGTVDPAHLRVVCEVTLGGEVKSRTEWVWNTDEETLLPPAQIRQMKRKMEKSAEHRQKINNFNRSNGKKLLQKQEKCDIIMGMSSEDGENAFSDT